MKLYWTGTDSLMLLDISKRKFTKKIYWLIFRVLIRIMDFFIEAHYCDSEHIKNNVTKFGTKKPISVLKDTLKYTEKYNKIPHKGFNIMYYFPDEGFELSFRRWLYGKDIIEELEKEYSLYNPNYVKFIRITKGMDMKKIFPIIDFYVRPNRHDGSSRLVRECEIQDIPCYHSTTDPDINKIFDLIFIQLCKR